MAPLQTGEPSDHAFFRTVPAGGAVALDTPGGDGGWVALLKPSDE